MASNNISPYSPSKTRKALVQPQFIVQLSFSHSDYQIQLERSYGAKSSYNGSTRPLHRSSPKNGDNALYCPPFRRVRRREADRPGNRKGMNFMTKNILLWAKKKKTETCRVKTDSTLRPHKPICVLKQAGQQTENEKRINFFQEGLKARGLSSRIAPKYCTLDNSADFFRYLGYQVSRKDDTDVMTD